MKTGDRLTYAGEDYIVTEVGNEITPGPVPKKSTLYMIRGVKSNVFKSVTQDQLTADAEAKTSVHPLAPDRPKVQEHPSAGGDVQNKVLEGV